MVLSARGAQKRKEDSKRLQMYSKQWLPGDTMRLFIPIFQQDGVWEIAVGAVWGHKVNDFEGIGLKTTFIPSLTDFDENGDPIGAPDITYQFSRIAPAFIRGQKALEEKKLQEKKWPTEAARKEALQKLEYQYDTKNNMKAYKPAIGSVTYYISTEVLCLKFTNGVPVNDTMVIASLPLSSQRIDQLYTILQDSKYAPMEGDKFLEVEWKYPANPDKGQSAKASNPAGLTSEYRLVTAFPDTYKQLSSMMSLVATESESIQRRATKKVDESKIRGALTQYAIMNSESIDASGDESEEMLLRNAGLIHELKLDDAMSNVELVEKLKAELANNTATQAETIPDLGAGTQTQDLGAADAIPGAQTPDLAAGAGTGTLDLAAGLEHVTGAPNMQGLLNNQNLTDMGEDEMMAVNLDMM